MKIYLSTCNPSNITNPETKFTKFIDNINRRFPLYLLKDEFFSFKNNQERVIFFYLTHPCSSSTAIATIIDKYIYPNLSHLIENYTYNFLSDSLLIKLNHLKYIFTIVSNSCKYNLNNLETITILLKSIVPFLNFFDQLNIDSIVILLPPEFKYHELYIRNTVLEFENDNPISFFNQKNPLYILEINKNKLQPSFQYSNKKLIEGINTLLNSQLNDIDEC